MGTDWDVMRIFLASYEARSFSKAAEALAVGQATVSRRIAELERESGHVLFERTQSGLLPTAAADLLHPYAVSLDTTYRQATATLQGFEVAPQGDVRLALTSGVAAVVFPRFAAALVKRHPELRIHISVEPADVARHEADIAIRNTPPASGDLLVRKLVDVEFGIFASAGFVSKLPKRPKLADLDFIGWQGANASIAPAAWLRERVERAPVLTVDDTVVMSALARQGIGAVIFPELLASSAGLVRVPVKCEGIPPMAFYLVTHPAMRHVPRVKVVVEYLLEALAEARR